MEKKIISSHVPSEVLTVYEKSQDSAEHYNTMTWTLMSILLGFSLYILKLVWMEQNKVQLELMALYFGIGGLIYFSYLIESANEKKLLKYYICKYIKERYKLIKQNQLVDRLKISNIKMSLPLVGVIFKNTSTGTIFFRVIKFILYFVYILSMLVYTGPAISGNWTFMFSLIFMWSAIIGALCLEVIYCKTKNNFTEIIEDS